MFRYAIVLLLISPYHYSLGYPTRVELDSLLAVSLKSLSNDCENSFLTNKIQEKFNNCNITLSKTTELGIRCMMFYDINSQLCKAFKHSKIDLEEDFIKNFSINTDVKTICNDVQTWEFRTHQEFPGYKLIVEKLVKHQPICLSICKEEDILSEESNFYCKYFKWGSHLIHNQKIASKQDISKEVTSKGEQLAMKSINNSIITTTTNNAAELNSTQNSKAKEDVNDVDTNELVNPVNEKKPLQQLDIVAGSAANSASSANMSSNMPKSMAPVAAQAEKSAVAAVNRDKPLSVEVPPNKGAAVESPKNDEENTHTGIDTHAPNNEANIESPKSQDPDDGQDDDIGNDPDLDDDDTIGDQDGMQDDGLGLNDPKLESEKTKSSEKKIESITSLSEDIQREINPITIQETFVEDDDHFFPFFLTSIVLVILLYVLYHNKNKLMKVILGMIVEGRQSGRRRNSRGHSYRRLDTLEQAMSTNSAAPPSKIIY